MQALQSVVVSTPFLARQALPRRAVLVSHDASSLSLPALSVADMVASRCHLPLCIVSDARVEVSGLKTPPERCRIIGSNAMPNEALTRRTGDLVVVAVPAGWESSALEAHALRLAAKAQCSVWVGRGELDALMAPRAPRRILVAVSDSARAAAVLALAASMASRFGAELTVAHVIDDGVSMPSDPSRVDGADPSDAVVAAHARLAARCDMIRNWCPGPILAVPIGDVADTLIGMSSGYDLVVVGRAQSAGRFWEPGSVAARLAADSTSSVLVVR